MGETSKNYSKIIINAPPYLNDRLSHIIAHFQDGIFHTPCHKLATACSKKIAMGSSEAMPQHFFLIKTIVFSFSYEYVHISGILNQLKCTDTPPREIILIHKYLPLFSSFLKEGHS